MMYVLVKNGEVAQFPYTITDLRRAHNDVSFPIKPSEDALVVFGVYPVQPAPTPEYDAGAQAVQQVHPQFVGGVWVQCWQVRDLSADELKAAQNVGRDEVKRKRQEAVARIRVTTASGKTFDGDETSQTRMARAVVALQAAGQTETLWVLADNTPATVTLAELAEALALAGAEQTRLWVSA